MFGSIVGSFLNVCIHRMPLGQSIVSPPSHCPHCQYSIPWYLNIPLVTWVYLGGKCANCRAPISIRYFLVELLTGALFLACWLKFGHQSAMLALVYCVFLAGLIAATFIDFEHYIIPDEITIGGIVAGFLLSLLLPALHGTTSPATSLWLGFAGIAFGGGLIYLVLRLGKLAFGRQKVELPAGTKVIFTEIGLVLPDQEILYEELFYRKSDVIKLEAVTAELCDRCYREVSVRLTPSKLSIGEEVLNPDEVPYLEVMTLGWQAVAFSLMASSVIGSIAGVAWIISKGKNASSRLPYGPYIAMAAVLWIFWGQTWWQWIWSTR
jgi:leader peptidase (prepilin peptidase)/N-methyltransferase